MTTYREMPRLKKALAAWSYDRLEEARPDVAAALRAEIAQGANPDEVWRLAVIFTESKDISRWLHQAALYLAGTEEAT